MSENMKPYGENMKPYGENTSSSAATPVTIGVEPIEVLDSYLQSDVLANGDCVGMKPRFRWQEEAWNKINELIRVVNGLIKIENARLNR